MTLLPPNATVLERAIETATARLSDVPVPIATLFDPDTCAIGLLPYLAWALSIDGWSTLWTEADKRERVREAIMIQRRKGSARSVRDVVAASGGRAAIVEWWQRTPRAEPYTFNVTIAPTRVDGTVQDTAFADQLIADIRRTMPVRAAFTVSQRLTSSGVIAPVAAARTAFLNRLAFTAPAA